MRVQRLMAAVLFAFVSAAYGGPAQLTYQGSLLGADGQPVGGGTYDMRFTIFDAASSGSVRWQELDPDVLVTNGLFCATLGDDQPFGSDLFSSSLDLWLEVAVDMDGNGAFDDPAEIHLPRQKLSSAAWAIEADRLQGLSAAEFALVSHSHSWGEITSIPSTFPVTTQAAHDHDSTYWNLAGNSGTTSGTQFLGTVDNQPLQLRVNNANAMRLEPNTTCPNLIGGSAANTVTPDVVGATIGGGGYRSGPNRVTDRFGTVGGGRDNTAGDGLGTPTDARFATVGGGYLNRAAGLAATVGGGWDNLTSGSYAAIAGGWGNTAGGASSIVGGGALNYTDGEASIIGGGYRNAAGGLCNTIGGGLDNASTAAYTVVAGGQHNMASGAYAAVAGGAANEAIAGWSVVAGGSSNTAGNVTAAVGGGWNNVAGGDTSTIAGGRDNHAVGNYSTIGGGRGNYTTGTFGTVPGGLNNSAEGGFSFAAGRRAQASHRGAFVWADSTNADFASAADNQFLIRASGGVGINTASTLGYGLHIADSAGLDGLLDMGSDGSNARIVNVADPTSPQDAATKNYVDATVGGLSAITAVQAGPGLGGGGASGDVTLWVEFGGNGSFTTAARSDHQHASTDWSLTGNSGTNPGTNFLGTLDNQPLQLRVNNVAALRLEPNTTCPNLIGGNAANTVTPDAVGATIGGGGYPGGPNRVTDRFGTVGGGRDNMAGDNRGTATNARYATVGGGYFNTAGNLAATVAGGWENFTSGSYSTIAGGWGNIAAGESAMVGGGGLNYTEGEGSAVAGGYRNTAGGPCGSVGGGLDNTSTAGYSTIGGGRHNVAAGRDATVSGGVGNEAAANWSVVSGGSYNTADNLTATVGGGWDNIAGGDTSTVAGGRSNEAVGNYSTIGGGRDNQAPGNLGTVAGGHTNQVTAYCATVPGGRENSADGKFSFAAGRRAKARNAGCFVWADSHDADFEVAADDRFAVRAGGGVYFYTTDTLAAGAYLAAGSGSWTNMSDREAKENVVSVDGRKVLEQLASIPMSTWNYKSQDPSIRHMGPMAQDVYASFSLGDSDKGIATIDATGISLAAIQGLYQIVREKDAQIAELQQRLAALETVVDSLNRQGSFGRE